MVFSGYVRFVGQIFYSCLQILTLDPVRRLAVFTITSLLFLGHLCIGMTTDKYTTSLPETATVVHSWDELREKAKEYPESILKPWNGGHVMLSSGAIVVATDDSLTSAIDEKHASMSSLQDIPDDGPSNSSNERRDGEYPLNHGAAQSISDRSYHQIYPPLKVNRCRKHQCFTNSHCMEFSDCHICSYPPRGEVRGRCL